MLTTTTTHRLKENRKRKYVLDLKKNWTVYCMFIPVIVFYVMFHYRPMAGIMIAFKDYKPALGIWSSPWTTRGGFKHFISFFQGMYFARTVRNTIFISLLNIVFSFPTPIILAIMLSELRNQKFKRVMQTVTYFPHFISSVVVAGMLTQFCLSDGLFNYFRSLLGLSAKSMLQEPSMFRTIYIGQGVWSSVGWNSIIYLAAITSIDTQLYEAAAIDGAKRWQRILHITVPGIKGTVVILFILQIGRMMSVGSDMILLLYNPTTYETADVISTYVYRKGMLEADYSFSTAVNLFNSVINFTLVYAANFLSSKATEVSLF